MHTAKSMCLVVTISIPLILVVCGSSCSAQESKTEIGGQSRFVSNSISIAEIDDYDEQYLLVSAIAGIYKLERKGGRAIPLLQEAGWAGFARRSPLNDCIAFISDRDGGLLNAWITDHGFQVFRQVTTNGASQVSWGANGTLIVDTSVYRLDGNCSGGSVSFRKVADLDGRAGLPDFTSVPFIIDAGGLVVYANGTKVERRTTSPASKPETVWTTNDTAESIVDMRCSEGCDALAVIVREDELSKLVVVNSILHAKEIGGHHVGYYNPSSLNLNGPPFDGGKYQHTTGGYLLSEDGYLYFVSTDGSIHRSKVSGAAGNQERIDAYIELPDNVDRKVAASLFSEHIRNLRWPDYSQVQGRTVFSMGGYVWTSSFSDMAPTRLDSRNDFQAAPTISRSGDQVAFVARTEASRSEVRVVDFGHEGITTVLSADGLVGSLEWDNQDQSLYFLYLDDAGVLPDRSILRLQRLWLDGRIEEVDQFAAPEVSLYSGMPPIRINGAGTEVYTIRASGFKSKALFTTELESGSSEPILRFTASFDNVIVSPCEDRLLVSDRSRTWIVELDEQLRSIPNINTDTLKSVSSHSFEGATFIRWVDCTSFVLSRGDQISIYSLRNEQVFRFAKLSQRFVLPGSTKQSGENGKYLILGANVVFVEEGVIGEDYALLIEDGALDYVGPPDGVIPPSGAAVINLDGKWVIPGLIDTHAHVFSRDTKLAIWDELAPSEKPELRASLAYGVTTVFDPSSHGLNPFVTADLVSSDRIIGPHIFATGAPFLGSNDTTAFVEIGSLDDALRELEFASTLGAIMIKSYMMPRRDQRLWLLEAADRYGIGVTAEGGRGVVSEFQLIKEGHKSIEHLLERHPIREDITYLTVDNGVIWTPLVMNLIPLGIFSDQFYSSLPSYSELLRDKKVIEFYPNIRQRVWGRALLGVRKRDRKDLMPFVETLQRFAESGAKIAAGTHGWLPGLGVHYDIWAIEDLTSSPLYALRSATIYAAEKLGLENELGSLQEGKQADLVILSQNPLENIRSTSAIEYVVKGGRIFSADTLEVVDPLQLSKSERSLSTSYN